jgi:hypothetical protein
MRGMHTQNMRRPLSLPVPLTVVGLLTIAAATALALRLVWEQTALSWRDGPQMVGFSIAHQFPLLLFAPFPLLAWLAVLVVSILTGLARRRRIARGLWVHVACVVFVAMLLALPYGVWQWLFVDRIVSGRHAAAFITDAAVRGDLRLVKALVSRGVEVDAADVDGQTGLHAAAFGNRIDVLEYLISQGADVNVLDRYGDSPLEKALAEGAGQAAALLESRGAHRIRGSDEQRAKASEEIVRGVDRR